MDSISNELLLVALLLRQERPSTTVCAPNRVRGARRPIHLQTRTCPPAPVAETDVAHHIQIPGVLAGATSQTIAVARFAILALLTIPTRQVAVRSHVERPLVVV